MFFPIINKDLQTEIKYIKIQIYYQARFNLQLKILNNIYDKMTYISSDMTKLTKSCE